MIASWMFYCALCALGLALAAVIVERVLLAGRGPVRHVWFGAVVLSLIVPVVAFRYAPRRVTAAPATVANHEANNEATTNTPAAGIAPSDTLLSTAGASTAPTTPARTVNWRGIIDRADQPLTIAWLTLSFALAVHFLVGLILLARTRRAWGARVVLGVPVLVSERTGPALVGAVSPAIVVPEWALALEAGQLALMLRHEQEHQRARDGQLLFAAQLALIAMPWNVALWWQVLRLRVAVELDCDARVLRDADARSYGNLLLEVIRPRPALTPLGVASFAERATQLERRIRVMTGKRVALRGARVLAACVALAAVTIAWIAPRPPVPVTVQAPVEQRPTAITTPTATTTTKAITTAPAIATGPAITTDKAITAANAIATATSPSAPPSPAPARAAIDSAAAPVVARVDTARVDSTALATGRGGRGGGRGGMTIPMQIDLIYGRLFDSISLTPEQAAQARAIVTDLVARQRAAQDSALPNLMAFQTRTMQLRAERDTALLALLANEADRDSLRARLTPGARGGGGGQRGGGPVQAIAPVGGGGRGTVAGGGGRTGGPGGAVPDVGQIVDLTYTRLFEGLVLTPNQEASARAAILRLETERRAAQPAPIRQVVGFGLPGTVVIEAKADSALMSILSTDADKQKLRARMINPPPQRVP